MENYIINENYNIKQSEATYELLKKDLTFSSAEKIWPENGIRGINAMPVAGITTNDENPGEYYTDACFKRLKSLGINSLRVPIDVDEGTIWIRRDILTPVPIEQPLLPYTHHLEALKVALHLAEKYDMWIIVTCGNIAGRHIDYFYNNKDGNSEGYFKYLKILWDYIVDNFGKHPKLLGYDLLNEPYTESEKEFYHNICLPELINDIRKKDKNTYIVVESAPFALPVGFDNLPFYDYEKIVYSPHWYFPHMYTHQGLGSYPKPLTYPGELKCFDDSPLEYWNKEKLREYLKPVIDFQKKNNAIIWIGEFSAIRTAPGAAKWLSDSIEIFEEYGWSWAVHSYRGWNGWNHTFAADAEFSNIDDGWNMNDRLEVLINGFSKNNNQ